MARYSTLAFVRSPGGGVATYRADDTETGNRYTIEESGEGRSRYRLTVTDESQSVADLGRFPTVTDASYTAHCHLDGIREDRAQRTVIEHPCTDGSLLSIFSNDFTGITEVIVNDDPGSGDEPRILQLDREQVIALQSALGRVLDGTVSV